MKLGDLPILSLFQVEIFKQGFEILEHVVFENVVACQACVVEQIVTKMVRRKKRLC